MRDLPDQEATRYRTPLAAAVQGSGYHNRLLTSLHAQKANQAENGCPRLGVDGNSLSLQTAVIRAISGTLLVLLRWLVRVRHCRGIKFDGRMNFNARVK